MDRNSRASTDSRASTERESELMAYKPSYKIPNSLDKSFLDQEITLSKKGIVKAIPLKGIIFYLVSVIGLFWVVESTFVKAADFIWVFWGVIWWILAIVFFGRR